MHPIYSTEKLMVADIKRYFFKSHLHWGEGCAPNLFYIEVGVRWRWKIFLSHIYLEVKVMHPYISHSVWMKMTLKDIFKSHVFNGKRCAPCLFHVKVRRVWHRMIFLCYFYSNVDDVHLIEYVLRYEEPDVEGYSY